MNLFSLILLSVYLLIPSITLDDYKNTHEVRPVNLTQAATIHSLLERHMNRFETVRRLLQNSQVERIEELQADIEKSLSFIETWERSRQSLARGIRVRSSSDHPANRLAVQFVSEASAAQNVRMEFSMAISLYTGQQDASENLIEMLDNFLDKHRAMIKTGYELFQLRSEFDIHSIEILYGPSIVDGREGADFIFENTRTETVRNLSIRLESMRGDPDGIVIEPIHIRQLSPGEVARFRISVPSGIAVDDIFQLTVEGEDVWVQENVRIYTD